MDEISSRITAQIHEFCESTELFQGKLQNAKQQLPTSSSPDHIHHNPNSFHNTANNLTLSSDDVGYYKFSCEEEETLDLNNFHTDHLKETTTSTSTTTTAANNNTGNTALSFIFDDDSQDELLDNDDISASIDFSIFTEPFIDAPSSYDLNMSIIHQQEDHHHQLDVQPSSQLHQLTTTEHHDDMISIDGGLPCYYPSTATTTTNTITDHSGSIPFNVSSLPPSSVLEDDNNCLSTILPFCTMNTNNHYVSSNYSNLDPNSLVGSYNLSSLLNATTVGVDNPGLMLSRGALVASGTDDGLQVKEPDYHQDSTGGGGIYCPDHQLTESYNPSDVQALLGNESQLQMVNGSTTTTTTSPTPPLSMTDQMTNLDDSSFKVGKLSVEQRKEKIHRYLKKRNERNFSKKIKYACRKTLADSRPRVRGRFAKNEDCGDARHRHAVEHNDDDDNDEVTMKEDQDDLVDSSTDIFTHISGVNSFKYGHPMQSWTWTAG